MRGITTLRRSVLRRLLAGAGFREIREHWIYEPPIKPGANVVDLGANKGDFSREVATRFDARCYAVEANETLFRAIDFPGVSKFNVAVAAADGPVEFFLSRNPESSSAIPEFQSRWESAGKVVVDGLTWSSLLNRMGLDNRRIDVLKIDIEGAELDLIDAMTREDFEKIGQITVEFHDWLNPALHDRTMNVINRICAMGFEAITDAPDHSWPVEILFIRKQDIDAAFVRRLRLAMFEGLRFLRY